jgi:FkbM family methyltransferase
MKNIIRLSSGYELKRLSLSSLVLLKEKDAESGVISQGMSDLSRVLRLQAILKKYKINVVLDVGANEGQFARELRHIYKGKIISFEPLSTAFAKLKQSSMADPNWTVYNFALGRQNGCQKIHVSPHSVFTSFLKTNSWCNQHFGENSTGSREEIVTVRRLDDVLSKELGNLEDARIYLKMDTQGYDLEVFSGLGGTYEMISALQSEISVIPIYQDMPHLADSIVFFEKAGFKLSGMYPVTQDENTLQVIEFDCLMVNSNVKRDFANAS